MSDNFEDILNEIKNISSTNEIQVKVPSRKNIINVKPVTLKQQRSIIETSVDGTLGVLFLNTTIHAILEQNIGNNIDSLNTIDRVVIALALRNKLSPTVKVDNVEYKISDVIDQKIVYDIKPFKYESDNYIFHVSPPSLRHDNKINTLLLDKYKGRDIKKESIKQLIGDLYTYEISKFLEKVEIKSTSSVIDVKDDPKKWIPLLEHISGDELTEITKFISIVRQKEKEFTKIPSTEAYIDIVPEFFVV